MTFMQIFRVYDFWTLRHRHAAETEKFGTKFEFQVILQQLSGEVCINFSTRCNSNLDWEFSIDVLLMTILTIGKLAAKLPRAVAHNL